jgi:integrase
MTTTFFIRSKSNDTHGVIHFLFSTGYGKIKSTTGLKINKKDWLAGFPKKTVATTEIRSLLTSFKVKIDKSINDLIENQNRLPNKSELTKFCKSVIMGERNVENSIFLSDLIDQFILDNEADASKGLAKGTMKYKKNHLKGFLDFCGQNSVISELNEYKIDAYKAMLFRDGNENSTKNNYRKSIMSFLNWLKAKRISNIVNEIDFGKFVEPVKDVIALTEDELRILEKAKLTPALQKHIDIFLLGCYTALSISDIVNIAKDKIEDDHIHTRRIKTDELLKIPLIAEAKQILEKYNYDFKSYGITSGRVQLKKAFKELGLNRRVRITSKIGSRRTVDKMVPLHREISWHKARKTAITTLLSKGVDQSLVMMISGHKDHRAFRKYIDGTDLLMKEMKKLRGKKDDDDNEEATNH